MKTLRVLLLGPPVVRWGRDILTIQRRYPRALLFYLAARGNMVGRNEILPLLWEDEDETTSRLRLRETLHRLRSALPSSDLLLSEGDLIGLNFQNVYVDVLDFQSLINNIGNIPWKIPDDQPLPNHIVQPMRKAVDLWRGTRFMAGIHLPNKTELDRWLTESSRQNEYIFERAIERLCLHAFVTGDLDNALRMANMVLKNSEFNDHMHEIVLRSLLAMGRPHEAREHYKYLRTLFEDDLHGTTLSRLSEFYFLIEQEAVPKPVALLPTWRLQQSLQIPFIGRNDFLESLQTLYESGGACLILGESGSGKTRLLHEFVQKIKPKPRQLVAQLHENERILPYQPFIQILRESISKNEWETIPQEWIGQVTDILPEMLFYLPGEYHPASIETRQSQAHLFEGVRQVLLKLAAKQRLLLIFDDIHWLDESSMHLLSYLITRPPFGHNASFIGAARREISNLYLEKFAASIRTFPRFKSFNLPNLNLDEITSIFVQVLGCSPPPDLVNQLAEVTGGNVFYLLETLRGGFEIAHDSRAAGIDYPITKPLESMIEGRLAALSHPAQSVLKLAAVIGLKFNLTLLQNAKNFVPIDLVSALEELHGQGLIQIISKDEPEIIYQFVHGKVREVLLQNLSPVRARYLHKEVARAIEMMDGIEKDVTASILADHYTAAGEYRTAFQYRIQAGRYAQRLWRLPEANAEYRKAEELLDRNHNEIPDDETQGLFIDWNHLLYLQDNTTELQKHNRKLLKTAEQRHSYLLQGTALHGLCLACLSAQQYEEGIRYSTQAIEKIKPAGDSLQYKESIIGLGTFLFMRGDWQSALRYFEQSLNLGIRSSRPEVIRAEVNALHQISFIKTLDGWPEIGKKIAQQSIELTLQAPEYRHAYAYGSLAISAFYLGEYGEAHHAVQCGLEIAEIMQNQRMLGHLLSYSGMVAHFTGKIGEAYSHAQNAIKIGEKSGRNDITALGYQLLGDIFFSLSSPRHALHFYQKGMKVNQNLFLTKETLFRLGLTLSLLGEPEAGEDYIQRAVKIGENNGPGLAAILSRLALAKFLALKKEWERVEEFASELEYEAGRRSLCPIRLRTLLLLGESWFHQGEIEKAQSALKAAADTAKDLPHPWIEISARKNLAIIARVCGKSDGGEAKKVSIGITRIEDSLQHQGSPQLLRDEVTSFHNKIIVAIQEPN